MPTGRDAALVCASLENNGISAQSCSDLSSVTDSIRLGAGAVLIAEEVFHNGALEYLDNSLARQPVWSDLPIVLFALNGSKAETLLENVGTRFNATIVERPIRITMLISAVRGALRARQRQYQARDMLTQLELADKQKDLFLATLSHELRTPLNSIVGWIPLLRRRMSDVEHLSRGLDVIERNAKLQTELISDILFLSRVITGKLELNKEALDLVSVVKAAIEDLRPQVKTKHISLAFDFDSERSDVMGDQDRLKQIFGNLLSNAVKFTEPGGRIDVRINHLGESVTISITDNGCGIEHQFLPFVFERFRQADGSYSRGIGGLGLGLAIVRHLVELHNGTVRAESDGPGRGASFIISLPTFAGGGEVSSKVRRTEPHSEDNRLKLSAVRVLLIDDDADSREMLSTVLQHSGAVVISVDSGASALEALEAQIPDILISDIGMPGENGYDLIARVRSLSPEQGGSVPAIAVTGYVSLQDRALAFDAGYQEHVAKPVEIDDLMDTIISLIKPRATLRS